MQQELRQAARNWLMQTDAFIKADGVRALARDYRNNLIILDNFYEIIDDAAIPGRPEKPELVAPRLVKRRAMSTAEGRAILIHALVHIEFNAINLALDAIWRFPGMPPAFYTDWLQVADEEAQHFSLLAAHLKTLGHDYGDFPVHGSLWEMAHKTRCDLLARMALVPRTLEARGLDVVPGLREKLLQAGDQDAAAILEVILRDEIGHVAIGNRWYGYLCQLQQLPLAATYARLAAEYAAPPLRGPFNLVARRLAGFSEQELQAMEQGEARVF